MIPQSFSYHRPPSIEEAAALLDKLGDDALLAAGGQSLIPMMKLRMATPAHLVDLGAIGELAGISISDGKVDIGAMTTQAELTASAELAAAAPIIRETALQIADAQVRNLGTIGGNVANGDPGNDMPALMMALDATYTLASAGGSSREMAARGFYEGPFVTARASSEILTRIAFDVPATGHGSSYQKQKRKIGDYATAAAAVILTVSDSKYASASIALTNVSDTPVLASDAADALVGQPVGSDAADAAAAAAKAVADPSADGRGPVHFRTHVLGVMVRRAILAAGERAT